MGPKGAQPRKNILIKIFEILKGLQMGPRGALPSGLRLGLIEGSYWGPFGLTHLNLSGIIMGWIWVFMWVQDGPQVGSAQ